MGLDTLPSYTTLNPPTILLLEAEPGERRRALLDDWLQEAQGHGARTWHLTCDFDEEGTWAGLRTLLEDVLPELQRSQPDLVVRHDYELLTVLPWLRREMQVRYPTLTDTALGAEKVRNYPIDRAYRIVHGLVDMMAAWHARTSAGPWVVACETFERVGHLVRRFFLELLRRRGQALQLTLVLAVAPGQAKAVKDLLPADFIVQHARLDQPPERPRQIPPEEAARLARELETRIATDLIEIETHLPRIISLWRQSGDTERLARSQALAFGLSNHYGLYEDALIYGRALTSKLDLLAQESPDAYWVAVGNLFNSYLPAGEVHKALELAQELEKKVDSPEQQYRLFYMLGILHSRYVPNPDLALGEQYLDRGIAALEQTDLPEEQKHFLWVFNRNGLAFIRHRQGRFQDAIDLCQQGAKRLDEHLDRGAHRLHRSVLQYNIAQVYAVAGEFEKAVAQYTAAIEMDPYFSEYYNERGSIRMLHGELEQALADLQRAEELSPPYPEVRINLGQCLRQMGRYSESFDAYSAALDLDPGRLLAYIGRAQVAESLERDTQALADYSAALAIDPSQPMVLANRAALFYAMGRPDDALADLDAAIALAPSMADLYQNRAMALADLGRTQGAVSDLKRYLEIAPEAEDHGEVETWLLSLQEA